MTGFWRIMETDRGQSAWNLERWIQDFDILNNINGDNIKDSDTIDNNYAWNKTCSKTACRQYLSEVYDDVA